MNWKTVVKAFAGGFMGLFLGTMAGVSTITGIISRHSAPAPPGEMVGIDVNIFLRSGVFWFVVLACTLGGAFLAARLGSGPRQSHL